MAAERGAADRVGGDRAEHDQPERPRLEVAQDQLEREEHAGDRRVERRRDPARRAARDEQPQLRLATRAAAARVTDPSAEPICTIGPSRPTEPPEPMHSAEASDLTTGTCGRIRPPMPVDREHHLGHAVTARLGREARDQRPVDQPADHGREHHEPDPQPGHEGVGRVAGGAVVAMPGEQVGEAEDHVAKRDRAQPGAHTVTSASAVSPLESPARASAQAAHAPM